MALLAIVGVLFYALDSIDVPSQEDGDVVVELTPEFVAAVEKYDELYSFSEGFAPVVKDGKFGCINSKGEEIVPCRYEWVFPFSEGFASVDMNGKTGFINTKGEETAPCIYDFIREFSEGIAIVQAKGKWGAINTEGKVVIPIKYDSVGSF